MFRSFLRGDDHAEANARYLERFVKFLLWAVGGFRVYLAGCERYARAICDAYTQTGARAFDVGFMRTVYERPVEVIVPTPRISPGRMRLPRPSAVIWTDAGSVSTPAGATGKYPPW